MEYREELWAKEVYLILESYIKELKYYTAEELAEVLNIAFSENIVNDVVKEINLEKLEELGVVETRCLTEDEIKNLELRE